MIQVKQYYQDTKDLIQSRKQREKNIMQMLQEKYESYTGLKQEQLEKAMQAAINNIEEGRTKDEEHKSKMLAKTESQNEK